MRRLGVVLGAVAVTALLSSCMGSAEQAGFNAVNADRKANGGVAALSTNDPLVTKAQNWAQHLAAASGGVCSGATLVHSSLVDGAPAGWRKLGENIACRWSSSTVANEVNNLETQFMNSSGHRANILDPAFNRGGVGLASAPASTGSGIIVFETQEFAQL
jgi:uncharacterized protein YkwD